MSSLHGGDEIEWPADMVATDDQRVEILTLFPAVPPPYRPVSRFILVQERLTRGQTKSGLILSDVTREADRMRMNIGRIRALGPWAQLDQYMTLELPEDQQFKVGMFVRIPKFGSDKPEEGKVVWRMVLPDQISAIIIDAEALLR